jgi:hypothetical protein
MPTIPVVKSLLCLMLCGVPMLYAQSVQRNQAPSDSPNAGFTNQKKEQIELRWGKPHKDAQTEMFFMNSLSEVSYRASGKSPGAVSIVIFAKTPDGRRGEIDCFASLPMQEGIITPTIVRMGSTAAVGNADYGLSNQLAFSPEAVEITVQIYSTSKTTSGQYVRAEPISNVLTGTLHRSSMGQTFFLTHPQKTESLSFGIEK